MGNGKYRLTVVYPRNVREKRILEAAGVDVETHYAQSLTFSSSFLFDDEGEANDSADRIEALEIDGVEIESISPY